jgi:pimeloyl-ACP methyl ester carboxylesterase
MFKALPALGLVAAGLASAGSALRLQPCHLDGLAEEVLCGTLSVPENRSAPAGRHIELRLAVLPALGKPAPDPLFILAGGPGQAATGYAALIPRAFRKVRAHRDIVLVDQRGTGESHPLKCKEPEPDLAGLLGASTPLRDPAGCLARLDADAREYTDFEAMEDLDAVRAALGAERIDLWGGSYGTRAALVYLRLHPERVRSVVLDGVVPFAMKYPLYTGRDGQRALDLLLRDCSADPACSAAFPDLRHELDALFATLERSPAEVEVRNSRTGWRERVTIGPDALVSGLRGSLYSAEQASVLPLAIHRAAAGDFEPYAALVQAVAGWSVETMSLGMTLSVVCSEDVSRISEDEAERWTRGNFVGRTMMDSLQGLCAAWPRGSLPEGYDQPVHAEAPALLLSGALDPVAPPEWGDLAAKDLPASKHVVVPGTAHNTSHVGCVPSLIATFIENGSAAGLDTSCVEAIRRPPFVLDTLGTLP